MFMNFGITGGNACACNCEKRNPHSSLKCQARGLRRSIWKEIKSSRVASGRLKRDDISPPSFTTQYVLYSNNKIKKNFFQIITCGLLSATLCPERHVRWTTCAEAPALPRDRLQQFLLVSLFPRPSSGTGTSTAGPSALPRPGPVSPRPTPHNPATKQQAQPSARSADATQPRRGSGAARWPAGEVQASAAPLLPSALPIVPDTLSLPQARKSSAPV